MSDEDPDDDIERYINLVSLQGYISLASAFLAINDDANALAVL